MYREIDNINRNFIKILFPSNEKVMVTKKGNKYRDIINALIATGANVNAEDKVRSLFALC
jgi:hypothetical protein